MAKISFTGFVEAWRKDDPTKTHPDWAMKVTEPHRREIDGKWETVGRTYRQVKTAYGVSIDFTQFKPGDRVEISGTEITETREYNGQKYYDLTVKADEVKQVMPAAIAAPRNVGSSEPAPFPLEDAPF
jgi:hypothetical protein